MAHAGNPRRAAGAGKPPGARSRARVRPLGPRVPVHSRSPRSRSAACSRRSRPPRRRCRSPRPAPRDAVLPPGVSGRPRGPRPGGRAPAGASRANPGARTARAGSPPRHRHRRLDARVSVRASDEPLAGGPPRRERRHRVGRGRGPGEDRRGPGPPGHAVGERRVQRGRLHGPPVARRRAGRAPSHRSPGADRGVRSRAARPGDARLAVRQPRACRCGRPSPSRGSRARARSARSSASPSSETRSAAPASTSRGRRCGRSRGCAEPRRRSRRSSSRRRAPPWPRARGSSTPSPTRTPRTCWSRTLGPGLRVVLIGLQPEFRLPFEGYYAFLAIRNGVPVGYGGGWCLFETLEFGFNIFESFRQGESAWILGQVLRAYHHVFRMRTVAVDPYQLGADNLEALRSGRVLLLPPPRIRASRRGRAAGPGRGDPQDRAGPTVPVLAGDPPAARARRGVSHAARREPRAGAPSAGARPGRAGHAGRRAASRR